MIPKIKNSFKNIEEHCLESLKSKYSAGIPAQIKERLDTELNSLQNSPDIDNLEILRRLHIEAKKSSNIIFARGTILGSFLYYLISDSRVNPLPPHYYCPHCGHYEEVKTKLFGIDLPPMKCPGCNSDMLSDGINISTLHACKEQNFTSMDINITKDFYCYAKRVLQDIYSDCEVVDYGISQSFSPNENKFSLGGFAILPPEKNIDDYPQLVTYLDDGSKCISGSIIDLDENDIKKVTLFDSSMLNLALYMQNRTGIYFDEISLSDIRNTRYYDIYNTKIVPTSFKYLADDLKPTSFRAMSDLISAVHNSYKYEDGSSRENEYIRSKLIHSEEFTTYPVYNREDVYDHLISDGFDADTAFAYSEIARKGIICHKSQKAAKRYADLLSTPVPEQLYSVLSNCEYLFPRAHSAAYIYIYAILAYYMKLNSSAYCNFCKSIE